MKRQRATLPRSYHLWSRSPSHGGEGRSRSPEQKGEKVSWVKGLWVFSGRFVKMTTTEKDEFNKNFKKRENIAFVTHNIYVEKFFKMPYQVHQISTNLIY